MTAATISDPGQALGYISATLEGMQRSFNDDRAHNAKGMERIDETLRVIHARLDEVGQLAGRHADTERSLERAWTHVNKGAERTSDLEKWKSKIGGAFIAFSSCWSLILVLVVFIWQRDNAQNAERDAANREDIQAAARKSEAIDERLQRLEIWAAGSRQDAYRRP